MNRNDKIKIIYIAGFGRSGSTLLDLIISTSNKVFSVGEIYNFNDIMRRDAPCACGENVADCNVWNGFFKKRDAIKINNLAAPRNYLKVFNYLYNFLFITRRPFLKNEDNYKLLSEIRKDFLEEGDFILDSSKDVTRLMELARDDRFDIYCIHVVRDGRGTASSYASKRGRTSQNFYWALFKWIVANSFTEKFLVRSGIKNIKISLNLFCENPDKHIKEISDFLGIEIPDNYREVAKDMDYHNIGGNRLSKIEKRRQFGGVRPMEGWMKERNVFDRVLSSAICYFFNKRWVYNK